MRSLIKLRRLVMAPAVLALCAGPLRAQGAERFRVRAWPEGVVLAVTAVAAWGPLVLEGPDPATMCPCDPASVPGLDRVAIGMPAEGPDRLSDVGMFGAAFLGGLLVVTGAPGGGGEEAFVAYAQSLGVTVATTNWIKALTRRRRPFLYAGREAEQADDAYSMPSGHTSVAFAAAAAYVGVQNRSGPVRGRTLIAGTLFSAATLTGVMRVASHKHFPTDVVAGAALGTVLGLLVPRAYEVR